MEADQKTQPPGAQPQSEAEARSEGSGIGQAEAADITVPDPVAYFRAMSALIKL